MLFDRIFEDAPDAMIVVDRAGYVTHANLMAEKTFGFDRGAMTGLLIEGLLSKLDQAAFPEVAGDTTRLRREFVGVRCDGVEFPVETVGSRMATTEGEWIVLSLRDVSEQRRIQDELAARASQQDAVADLGRQALAGAELEQLMGDAVGLIQGNLGVEYSNVLELQSDGSLVMKAGVGWRDGLAGQTAADPSWAIPAAQVLASREPLIVEDVSRDARFPDASLLRSHGVVSSLNVPLFGHDRPFGVLGAHSSHRRRFTDADIAFLQSMANVMAAALERDWYEQRQRERYMQRAEQMMALGQIAAGVAHELRNPLTSIKGLVQVNMREVNSQALPAGDLQVIEHEVRRMERTLQTFLDFARPPRLDRRPFDLADVVERVVTLVGGRTKKQRVDLEFSRPAGGAWVDGDQDQLQQLVLNLVLNALDAMPDGGAVTLELRQTPERQVELLVRDSGPGIPGHILPKVFETFVSSKETGMGLGLPVSKRIAEDHGGNLAAYNLPARGACLALRLPSLQPAASGRENLHAQAAGRR